jgi:hypothetical protein
MYLLHFLYPFICPWTFEWLGILAIVNNATMNMGVKMFAWFQFLCIYAQIAGLCGSHILIFWGISILFLIVATQFDILTRCTREPISLHPHHQLFYFVFQVDRHEMVSNYYFNLHFISLMISSVEHLFIYLVTLCAFFGRKRPFVSSF